MRLDFDPAAIANVINEMVGQVVETEDSVAAWLRHDGSSLPNLVNNAIASEIAEAYD